MVYPNLCITMCVIKGINCIRLTEHISRDDSRVRICGNYTNLIFPRAFEQI